MNVKRMDVALNVSEGIASFYRRDDTEPYIFDSRFIENADAVYVDNITHPVNEVTRLRPGQEYAIGWNSNVVFGHGDTRVILKAKIAKERGFEGIDLRRIATKFIDGNHHNMLSSNIALAELISVHSVWYPSGAERYITLNYNYSNNGKKNLIIPTNNVNNFFNDFCKDTDHPAVLLVNGVIKVKRNC